MVVCPICGAQSFREYGGRRNAMCEGCGSLERTRYLWLYLERGNSIAAGRKVLHVAPERCLSEKLSAKIGSGYQPVDFDPARYTGGGVTVRRFDMRVDLFALPASSLDVIMHLHVLEHIAMDLESLLTATMRALKPGGHFIFGVPIAAGITLENLSPDLTAEERTKAFGQFDHLRRIGAADFPRLLRRVLKPFSRQSDFRVDPACIGERVLLQSSIPFAQARGLTGNTLFDVIRAA